MYCISWPALLRVTGGALIVGALPPLAESSEAAPLPPPATCCGLRCRLRSEGASAAAAGSRSRGAALAPPPDRPEGPDGLVGRTTMGSTPLAAAAAAAAGDLL